MTNMGIELDLQLQYLNDPWLHAIVRAVLNEFREWDSHLSSNPSDKNKAEEKVHERLVALLDNYQKALRESNNQLAKEVARLKKLVVEPMLVGTVEIK